MDSQNIRTPRHIRKLHRYPPVKPARSQKRRVKRIGTVGRRKNDNALGAVKAVHLCKKLIQRLLPLVISIDLAVTFLSNRIDLVDKHDARRFFVGLLEQIPAP